jgi:hypothetical protein
MKAQELRAIQSGNLEPCWLNGRFQHLVAGLVHFGSNRQFQDWVINRQWLAISSGEAGDWSRSMPLLLFHTDTEKRPPAACNTTPEKSHAAEARNATPGATSSGFSSGADRRNTRVAATGDMAFTRIPVADINRNARPTSSESSLCTRQHLRSRAAVLRLSMTTAIMLICRRAPCRWGSAPKLPEPGRIVRRARGFVAKPDKTPRSTPASRQ